LKRCNDRSTEGGANASAHGHPHRARRQTDPGDLVRLSAEFPFVEWGTLAVYTTICRETGRPFVLPGSSQQWEGLTEVTDARILAKHLKWAATSATGRNPTFNFVNGDIFRWRWRWPKPVADFGIDAAPHPGRTTPLQTQLAGAGRTWADIAAKHGLADANLSKLASAWHTDMDLDHEIEVVTDMTKRRLARFHEYQALRPISSLA